MKGKATYDDSQTKQSAPPLRIVTEGKWYQFLIAEEFLLLILGEFYAERESTNISGGRGIPPVWFYVYLLIFR